MDKPSTIIVNLFGEPGSGKSTGAAYIFSMLKMMGINAELVTEFAKSLVWDENDIAFKCQPYIWGNQVYMIDRCIGKVDVIINDSPTLLSVVYADDQRIGDEFKQAVLNWFNGYKNKNYLILRDNGFQQSGRRHSKKQSVEIGLKIGRMLEEYDIPFHPIPSTQSGYHDIVDDILSELENQK